MDVMMMSCLDLMLEMELKEGTLVDKLARR